MQELEFSPEELKVMITKGKKKKAGFFGTLILYNNLLLKIDNSLYNFLRVNDISLAANIVNDYYKNPITTPFVDIEQIKYFCSKQDAIKLTDFDKGVVKVNNHVCGVILANHLDYQSLAELENMDEEQILTILFNTLLALRELELNGISQLDLIKPKPRGKVNLNILYKDTDIKLCDLSGDNITYGKNFQKEKMYQEYFKVFLYFIDKLQILNTNYQSFFQQIKNEQVNSYQDAIVFIKEFQALIKNKETSTEEKLNSK